MRRAWPAVACRPNAAILVFKVLILNRMGHFIHTEQSESNIIRPRGEGIPSESSPLYDRSGARKYLSAAERNQFLVATEHLSPAAETFCKTLAYTGCRLSEALKLCPRSFDFEARLVIVETLKKRRAGVFRAVPIPSTLLQKLDFVHGLKSAQGSDDRATMPLWRFGRTMAWTYVKRAMHMAGVMGVRSSPKGLRHSFAVTALQSGVPITFVRKWLGHSRISTTAIYADAVGEEEHAIAARMWTTFR